VKRFYDIAALTIKVHQWDRQDRHAYGRATLARVYRPTALAWRRAVKKLSVSYV